MDARTLVTRQATLRRASPRGGPATAGLGSELAALRLATLNCEANPARRALRRALISELTVV